MQDFLAQRGGPGHTKDPQLTEHLDKLEWLIDSVKGRCRFVMIVRDPRGVVNSYIHNKWGLGTNAYSGALRWRHEVSEQLKFMQKYPELVTLIRFEDLLENMEPVVRSVCAHIGIAFDPGMLNYYQQKAEFKTRSENINTKRKPDKKIAEKWRASLSRRDIEVIDYLTKDIALRLDYPVSNAEIVISKPERLYYHIHQKIIGEIQLQYRWRKAAVLHYLRQR